MAVVKQWTTKHYVHRSHDYVNPGITVPMGNSAQRHKIWKRACKCQGPFSWGSVQHVWVFLFSAAVFGLREQSLNPTQVVTRSASEHESVPRHPFAQSTRKETKVCVSCVFLIPGWLHFCKSDRWCHFKKIWHQQTAGTLHRWPRKWKTMVPETERQPQLKNRPSSSQWTTILWQNWSDRTKKKNT